MALAGTHARAIVLVALLSCLIGPAAARATTVQVDHFSTSATDTGAGADGVLAPGDMVDIGETLLSSEPTTLTNVHGTLSATTPGVTVGTPGPLAYPDIAFGDTGANTTPFTATLP